MVGHSGCGKSTVSNLLLRLYDISSGQILIDGVDIKDYDLKAYRQQLGLVMQEPLLFNSTIKSNIVYGAIADDQTKDFEVRRCCEMANAVEFIE